MSLIGLDIGTNSIKVVEIEEKKPNPVLINWGIYEIPEDLSHKHPEREAYQAEILKKFLSRSAARAAVVVIGGLDIVSKIISLPPLGDEEAENAVRWQMRDEIPFKVEEGLFSFYRLPGGTKDKVNYLVAAAKQNVVLRAVQTLNLANAKPMAVIPISEALHYTFKSEIEEEEDGAVCILSMGRFLTNISFYFKGDLQLSRDVPIGSDDITRAMTSILVSEEGRLELDYEQAERIRVQYGIPFKIEEYPKLEHIPIAHLQAVIRPALERIEEEITRTVEYFRNKINDANVTKIIFTGLASQTPHLAEFLSASIGIEFSIVDVFTNVTIDESVPEKDKLQNENQRLGAAVGAVLGGRGRINLVPKEYIERWRITAKKLLTPQVVSLIFILLMGLYWLIVSANIYFMQSEKDRLDNELKRITPMVEGLETRLKSEKEIAARTGFFMTIARDHVRVPLVMIDMSKNIPSEVILEEFTVGATAESFSVKGLAFKKNFDAEQNLSMFVKNLSASKLFNNVELVKAGLGLEYSPKNFIFEIKGKLKKGL